MHVSYYLDTSLELFCALTFIYEDVMVIYGFWHFGNCCASKLCCQIFGTTFCFHLQDWFRFIGSSYT